MRHYCFCCGSKVAVAVDVPHPRCYACSQGCAQVASEKVLRGPQCPFILRRGSTIHYVPELPPEPSQAPQRATGSKLAGDSFEWRGRVRRNVPGG